MQRVTLNIISADNGGLVFYGPMSLGVKSPAGGRQKTYISPTLNPQQVGETLLAMLTDVNMTKHDVKEDDLDITF